MNAPEPAFLVNEYAPDPRVAFDRAVGETCVRFAHRLANHGYVQTEVARSAASPAGRAELAVLGIEPSALRPEAFDAIIRADIEQWGKVAKSLGLKAD